MSSISTSAREPLAVIFKLVCCGCGASYSERDALPFRCPNFGDGDVDHVLSREGLPAEVIVDESEPNPFIRFRALSYPYDWARARGLSDADYCEIVRRLDGAVAAVGGRGFRVTPLVEHDGLLVKDETGNVADSHKGRHLMGIALQLEVAERLGRGIDAPLAIASCGNAALAAAVVARAARRPLRVFVPTSADENGVARLRALGAEATVCPRADGVAGDPSYLAFRAAVDAGALPFTCQGGDNGLTLDGGRTLGYELARQARSFDRIFIQVGGGALASATISALRESVALGWLARMPRVHAVQTGGCSPLARAWMRFQSSDRGSFDGASVSSLDERLRFAATHRSEFMQPWAEEPKSIAHGILDDETYDWLAIVRGMAETDGHPILVDEAALLEANRRGRAMGINVDHTGSAGLAGWLAEPAPADERVAIIFSGGRR